MCVCMTGHFTPLHEVVAPRCEAELGLAMYIVLQGPGLLKVLFGSLRGYAGDISPPSALDAVSNDGNALIIDIRCRLKILTDLFFRHNLCTIGIQSQDSLGGKNH